MSSHQDRILIEKLVTSDAFRELIIEIEKEMFLEWAESNDIATREALFHQKDALQRLVDTIQTKARSMISGDTK